MYSQFMMHGQKNIKSTGKITDVSKDRSVSIFTITDSLTCMNLNMTALRTI